MKKLRIGLIYGGKSGEHEVSLKTAAAVLQQLDFAKYDVIPFYITKQGEWRKGPLLTGAEQLRMLAGAEEVRELERALAIPGHAAAAGAHFPIPLVGHTSAQHADTVSIDVVMPLLHGTFGEDGTIQGLLELANVPYVGAGVLASAVGMDKITMKKIFAQEGLPQCLFRHFTRSQWEKDQAYLVAEIELTLGYPCFVKPANLGSSVGISKAANRKQLLEAVRIAFEFDRKVIVEESVNAREIEVSVLGNDEPETSVPGEVVSSNEFYDYRAKYVDGKSQLIIPADIPEETKREAQQLAVRAFQAIDGAGLARVDFFLTREDGRLLVNEINTMPGFTPYSMYPLLWKESGKSYGQLLDDLIRLALERHREKQRIRYTFEIE
jgi:D-alanine-D-alanine ligase